MHRTLRPGGLLLVKCKDYIWGGRYWPGAYLTLRHAGEVLDMELVDRFEHVGTPGPQPPGRPQRHARRNHSTLWVLRRTATAATQGTLL